MCNIWQYDWSWSIWKAWTQSYMKKEVDKWYASKFISITCCHFLILQVNYPQSKYIHFLACKKFSSNIINKDQRLVEEISGKLEEIFECSQRTCGNQEKKKYTWLERCSQQACNDGKGRGELKKPRKAWQRRTEKAGISMPERRYYIDDCNQSTVRLRKIQKW